MRGWRIALAEAEKLRRLPSATVDDYRESGLARLLLPARYGGRQAEFPEILDVVRRMAHGCASSAWTLGFYTLHNWMLALFCEQAQDEVFVDGPVLCPAPLAPTGRGIPVDGGIRLTGRWSWATGVMDADWVLVGAICGPDDAPYPALVLLPAADIRVEDVWHTAGMCATGSNDVVVDDVWVPGHRLVTVADIYGGTTPGAALHDAAVYRWPMVPALALTAAMPALGSAELVADLFAQRLSERVLAYSGVAQKDQPTAQVRLGGARVRLRALRELADAAAEDIQARVSSGSTSAARSAPASARPPRMSCMNPVQSSPICWKQPAPARNSWTTRCSVPSGTSTSSPGTWCSTTTSAASSPARWRSARKFRRSR